MNEENKFKMVFGKEVAQKEYLNLKNESKQLKPASINKLLGKRIWKILPTPDRESSDILDSNQTKRKKLKGNKSRRITRSMSLCEEISEAEVSNVENSQKCSTKFVLSAKKIQNDEVNKHLNIGRMCSNELPKLTNIEDYLAYHLRKVKLFN